MRLRHRSIPRAWSWARPVALACGLATLAVTALGCAQMPGRPDVVIGTSSPAGIDYPLGGAICRLFNLDTPRHGLRCAEEPSTGFVANVESLRSGRIDIGIVPSDVLADAVAGEGPFAARGPAADLRVLFAGHADVFTLVAHQGSGIRTVADLRGKRIGIGSPGSRQRASMERVLAALGLTRNDFAEVRELSPAEQNRAFCADELDAIVYSVGHPNGLVRDATLTCDGMLVAVSGPALDRMLSEYQEYERATIPAGTYPANPADVPTFGVRAVVVTTARMPDAVAYEITRAVFDHFDDFRRLHPAFEALSVARTAHAAGRAPVHAGAARYYREHGWLP
ncbi:MAG TPA: TAXI family TRAP transporter solute-binding subunit [Geminicoccaceae bacterium]